MYDGKTITDAMAALVFQLGVILFAVRVCGSLAKIIGIPQVVGELLAGVVIGPYTLGSIPLPGFPNGLFPLDSQDAGFLAPGNELCALASIASIIFLFVSGLETNISRFLRYSVGGGIIGICGVIFSFVFGNLAGIFLLGFNFLSPQCLFLGILSTPTSVGITTRILSKQKKMDSPEGAATLGAAVFDDLLGIIGLAVVLASPGPQVLC